jgi:Metallo-peptidase family M12B Reprolysin-like
MALAIAETNEGYAKSGVAPRLRLVGVAPTGSESGSMQVDLEALSRAGDGRFDEVQPWRDSVQADVVQMWMGNTEEACGMAWFKARELAYSIVSQDCATGNYSSGHEIGHNQGLDHDVYVAPQTGAYPYGHGYIHLAGGSSWRTVMAYPDGCFSSGIPAQSCPRLLYYSNPGVAHEGAPTGAADAFNARVLNETAASVASVRSAPTLTGDARYGGALTIVPGQIPAGAAISGYQWYVNNVAVPGAIGQSVQVQLPWIGASVHATYTVTSSTRAPLTIQSTAVTIEPGAFSVVSKPKLKIKKKRKGKKRGRYLKVKLAPWSPEPKYKIKWFRGKKRIKGAHGRKHRITRRDYGKKIRVKVTGKLAGYEKITVKSRKKKVRR